MEVERASSEILYTSSSHVSSATGSLIGASTGHVQVSSYARSRRSLAEPGSGQGPGKKVFGQVLKPVVGTTNSLPLRNASPTSEPPPPMIAPISGVPNLKVSVQLHLETRLIVCNHATAPYEKPFFRNAIHSITCGIAHLKYIRSCYYGVLGWMILRT